MPRPARLLPLLSALLLALGVLVILSPSLPAEAQRASPRVTYETRAFAATNNRRAAHDRSALRQQECVQGFAQRWATHMARRGDFSHQSLTPIMRRCGLRMAGENIALGYSTGGAVVRGWMHSAGHRENILRPGYRLMGIGARQDSEGRWWVSQVFGGRG